MVESNSILIFLKCKSNNLLFTLVESLSRLLIQPFLIAFLPSLSLHFVPFHLLFLSVDLKRYFRVIRYTFLTIMSAFQLFFPVLKSSSVFQKLFLVSIHVLELRAFIAVFIFSAYFLPVHLIEFKLNLQLHQKKSFLSVSLLWFALLGSILLQFFSLI